MSRPSAALLVVVFSLSLAFLPASAQTQANSVTLDVYSDGTAAITQVVSANATDTSISLQLLSSIIANPVVFDQNGSSLYFQITGSNITVYTIGATGVTLEYATTALTSKQGAVWTLEFTAYQNTTVVLPQQSTLTSVSGTPNQLSTSNGSPVVVVAPGTWEISYGVPIEVSTTSSSESSSSASTSAISSANSSASSTSSTSTPAGSTSTSSASTRGSTANAANSSASSASTSTLVRTSATSTSASQPYLIPAALVAVAIALAVATSWLILRRGGASPGDQASELRPDDVKVLDFISEKGGKVLEPEIRMRFALPKTSGWRQIKRLERLGYVKVTKIGSQNQIELLKKSPGAQS
jgi:uncharacterized membrane protein